MSPLANMLIQIKNGQAAGRDSVLVPYSRMKHDVAMILKRYGFIADIDKKKIKMKKTELPFIEINLGTIRGMRFISKPSRHMYGGRKDMKPVRSGYGIAVVSTSQGLMTSTEAAKAGVGGELLFEIW